MRASFRVALPFFMDVKAIKLRQCVVLTRKKARKKPTTANHIANQFPVNDSAQFCFFVFFQHEISFRIMPNRHSLSLKIISQLHLIQIDTVNALVPRRILYSVLDSPWSGNLIVNLINANRNSRSCFCF